MSISSKRLLFIPILCIILTGTCLYNNLTDMSNRYITDSNKFHNLFEYIENCTDWKHQDYDTRSSVNCFESSEEREGIFQIQKDNNELFYVSYINQSLQYGNVLSVRLDSYVFNGTVKSSNGGDFFYAILNSINNDNDNYSTAGKTIDHRNGSYSFNFAGAWSGPANLTILRVHHSDTVEWIRERMWKEKKRLFWKGIYECQNYQEEPHSHQKWQHNHTEETLCYVERNINNEESNELCLYRNLEALGNTTLTCEKPRLCNCTDLFSYRGSRKDIQKKADSMLKNRRNLFTGINLELYIIKNYEIYVADLKREDESALEDVIGNHDIRHSDGFWVNSTWQSYHCANQFIDLKTELKNCLLHKNISLLGDSTFRQWFHELVDIFDGEQHPDDLKMFHRVDDLDIDITFQFHPLCILQEQKIIPFASMKYESELIHQMQDCNRVIVVGPWAHYGQWTEQSYIDRLNGIRDSVVDFLKRCPEATVAVKGSHPRNHKNIYFYIYGNDYIFREYNRILREVFEGTGVVFLDVWDMNLSYYTSNTLHMPKAVIRQEMNLLFSCHVCR